MVARTSSFAYKGKAVDIRQVGKELGVDYVVEGSARKDGDKLRIVSLAHRHEEWRASLGRAFVTGLVRTHGHSKTRSLE